MPDGAAAYDETRVFMEGVRVEFDRENRLFHAYSRTVDGRTLHAILTPHACIESRRSLDIALEQFWDMQGVIELDARRCGRCEGS